MSDSIKTEPYQNIQHSMSAILQNCFGAGGGDWWYGHLDGSMHSPDGNLPFRQVDTQNKAEQS